MSRTHVWLLHPAPPARRSARPPILSRLSVDPERMPRWLTRLGWLGVWLWVRWWGPRMLIGPEPAADLVEAQARRLGALLGETCEVHAILEDRDRERAASHLGRGARVLLIPMTPPGGEDATSGVIAAKDAVEHREGQATLIPPLGLVAGYLEALAESTRAAIADLPKGAPYGVIYAAQERLGRAPNAPELADTVSALARRTGLRQPPTLAWLPGGRLRGDRPTLREALLALPQGIAVLVPLNSVSGAPHELAPVQATLDELALRRPALRVVLAPPVGERPTLIRALAEQVWQREEPAV